MGAGRGAWSVERGACCVVMRGAGMVNGKINNGELGVFIFPRDVGEKERGGTSSCP